MRYYLDTEFNEFGGELISMALVPAKSALPSFYEEVIFYKPAGPWVKENVIPKLTKKAISFQEFQGKLYKYLLFNTVQVGPMTIVTDYPDDLSYFVKALITGAGSRMAIDNIDFEMRCNMNYISAVPHNALEDAIGLRNAGEGDETISTTAH